MTDPKEKPEQHQKEENEVKEPTQEDGSNWKENQRIDEEGNELDSQNLI